MRRFILVLVMLVLVGVRAVADESGVCGLNLFWQLNSETGVLTISGTGEMWPYYHAFQGRIDIKKVVLGYGVSSIGEGVFSYCEEMEEVEIAPSVREIKNSAFYGCSSLKSLHIPNALDEIGVGAFSFCRSLKELDFPNTVSNISERAFYGCSSLEKISLSTNIVNIEGYAFDGCSNLREVVLGSEIPYSIDENAFTNTVDEVDLYKMVLLRVIPGEMNTFANALGWNKFENMDEFHVNPEEEARRLVDCNGDGVVNAADVVSVYNYIIGE